VIGAGPAGLVVAHVLHMAGIACVVLERQPFSELRTRMRAGMIEERTVELLRPYGLAEPILARGARNGVCEFRADGEAFVLDYGALSGGVSHYIYPQQDLVGDWAEALIAGGGDIRFGVAVVAVEQDGGGALVRGVDAASGASVEVACDAIACCCGARRDLVMPGDDRRTYAETYPFRWLTVIAEAAPSSSRTLYGLHRNGFAGQMRRSATLTRFMLEISADDCVADWPDDRIWLELAQRLEVEGQPPLEHGPFIERDILDLRVEVREPMQFGRVLAAGDAAHLITPAGGKGMNMAIQDAVELACGLAERYGNHASADRLASYSAVRLPVVWRYQEFSRFMLGLLHAGLGSPSGGDRAFSHALRRACLERLVGDPDYGRWFARAYVGVA
jgi:p-hydroxybenzoate 3-monooxygenase